ncbi:reverse transcriptase [Gossypium australe]|uniref:Reverse transcriptase n=1 Tax=Gossypium australe TaxID=47621 RepID=A0A5B6X159_9ROSI|nr:reverse transcriptase [Gossypium australe]
MTLSDIIIPERGLRQRDHLSPYLFLVLHGSFLEYVNSNTIKGIRASKKGPSINHLFFAEDALLSIRNKKSKMEAFTNILGTFEKILGQSINLDKSMVFCSRNTLMSQRDYLGGLLNMKVVDKFDNYLGLPLSVEKKKSIAFQTFLASEGIIEDIQSKISRMWWRGNDKSRSWSMLAWERVCFPKGRKVWRLNTCKDTLCFHVLSAKYFPNGDIFQPKCIDKPSYTWKRISTATRMLKNGFSWMVGDGNNIGIWRDNWGSRGYLFRNKKCVIFGTLIMWAGTKIGSIRFMAKTWGSRFLKFPLLLMALTIEEYGFTTLMDFIL